MKKVLSIVLSIIFIVGAVSFSASAESAMPFKDVKEKSWFYSAVKEVYSRGIMGGVSDTEFSPNGALSRAMFVTILGRLAGAPETGFTPDTFPDTKKNTWYSPYVGWAMEKGIVGGFDDGTFRPNANLTREQMAKAMAEYVKVAGINMPRENTAPSVFSDEKKIASWAKEYVEVLRRWGIVNGDAEKKYNPKKNITRAEAATIILNLIAAEDKAWQGYIPSPDEDSVILGARYLYNEGPLVVGKLFTSLDESDTYPLLVTEEGERPNMNKTYLPDGTTGVSISYLRLDLSVHPFAKICYKCEAAPKISLYCDGANLGELNATAGSDGSLDTLTVDMSAVVSAHPEVRDSARITNLILEPKDEKFGICYIGFFGNESSTNAFNAESREDYLKNYYVYSPVSFGTASDGDIDAYNKFLTKRILEIKNSESEITPEKIKAAGGKCYYVSSINGDDKNEGTSPDKAWKTVSKLYTWKAGGTLKTCVARPGDGVFFERGSVFYPYEFTNGWKRTIELFPGVSYGAYGKGEKPLFTGALDFTEQNGTGKWLPTEWENVYVLDKIYDDPDYCGILSDIGIIVFDGGKATGVRVVPDDDSEPFGEGKYTSDRGLVSNGLETYVSGRKSCETVGTALTNDLEFLHDFKEGKLYLYCKGGNPSDRFDDIKVGTKAYVINGNGNDIRVDNLAAKYSTWGLIDVNGNNIEITNCEAGWSSGGLESVDGSIGSYGEFDGYVIRGCYSHDIGDGAVTNQNSGGENVVFNNILYENNVFAATGAGVETWLHLGKIGEDGFAENRMKNITARGNIMAYMGYGVTELQARNSNNDLYINSFVDSSVYAECENCVIEDNLLFTVNGAVVRTYCATDSQPRGWIFRDNTYVLDTTYTRFTEMFETAPVYLDHNMTKSARATYMMDERTLKYVTSKGFDVTGKYFEYTAPTEKKDSGLFYTNGYLLENGVYPE